MFGYFGVSDKARGRNKKLEQILKQRLTSLNFVVSGEIKMLFGSVVIGALFVMQRLVPGWWIVGVFPPFPESINNRVYGLLNDAAPVGVGSARPSLRRDLFVPCWTAE